eukprot:COSAG01_NODE_15480_length_1332_cov_1.587997_3_plen_131_part_00
MGDAPSYGRIKCLPVYECAPLPSPFCFPHRRPQAAQDKCRHGISADCGRGFFLYLARRLLDDASLTFSKPVCGDASVVAAGGAQTKEFKVALVGNSGVGKSAMMHALISGQFLETHAPTPGVTVRALSRL